MNSEAMRRQVAGILGVSEAGVAERTRVLGEQYARWAELEKARGREGPPDVLEDLFDLDPPIVALAIATNPHEQIAALAVLLGYHPMDHSTAAAKPPETPPA
jgi:hypothetical protein